MSSPLSASLSWRELRLFPALHHSLESTFSVRQELESLQPEVVAVEYPTFLIEPLLRALEVLPKISYLMVRQGQERYASRYYQISPCDPLVEACRWAWENEVEIVGVDEWFDRVEDQRDPLLDSYIIAQRGMKGYWDLHEEITFVEGESDRERENAMACRLARLGYRRTLFVGGMAHVRRIHQRLVEGNYKDLEVPSIKQAVEWVQPDIASVRAMNGQWPIFEVLYELWRSRQKGGLRLPWPKEELSKEKSLGALDSAQIVSGLESLLRSQNQQETEREDSLPSLMELFERLSPEENKKLHEKLKTLEEKALTVQDLLGGEDYFTSPFEDQASESEEKGAKVFRFLEMKDRTSQLPSIYAEILDAGLKNHPCEKTLIDRSGLILSTFLKTIHFYQKNTGEEVSGWQKRLWSTFCQRYARVKGRLLPTWMEAVLAARACVDHNFAYEFWDLVTYYPFNSGEPEGAKPFRLDEEGAMIDGMRLKSWDMHRKLPRLRQGGFEFREREREGDPNLWDKPFDQGHICSFPPEDLKIEALGDYLRKKALSSVSSEKRRVEPFSTSFLDGIDIKETLRNWHIQRDIYVCEERQVQGGAGAVVVLFDKVDSPRYSWNMTWHGEHDQESDMAFFSTHPMDKLVGPGIGRSEYGGILLTYPPKRLGNVWGDPFYRTHCYNRGEVLLMAGIDYCVDKHIVLVAHEPPRGYFYRLAGRLGKKLVYLPIGSLSPTMLAQLRIFHVLAGHQIREIASRYIR